MPLNTLRLNQRQLHPNDRITFITALPGSTHSRAEDFLKRIAAICYPIMKAHSLSITTLEEFPPNREFMGRNFNGGEVIQLVLRRMPAKTGSVTSRGANGIVGLDPGNSRFVSEDADGGWLSPRAVQMVMMHELAHCMQMNHSKAFWKVRDEYAVHLKVLWDRGYTGEGMWGRGQGLESGSWDVWGGASGAGDFADLCGGTYRGRRRRIKQSYAERKKRRLEKTEAKFGTGRDVGGSEGEKLLLEGKRVAGKPRVANSKRGRDLRAAAALARFETAKTEPKKQEGEGSETETESEDEGEQLVDDAGKQVKDSKGNSLYRVREDKDDGQKRHELDELLDLETKGQTKDQHKATPTTSTSPPKAASQRKLSPSQAHKQTVIDLTNQSLKGSTTRKPKNEIFASPQSKIECRVCTLLNPSVSKTCQVCGSALAPPSDSTQDDDSWTCRVGSCKEIGYINPPDAGRCELCGETRNGA